LEQCPNLERLSLKGNCLDRLPSSLERKEEILKDLEKVQEEIRARGDQQKRKNWLHADITTIPENPSNYTQKVFQGWPGGIEYQELKELGEMTF